MKLGFQGRFLSHPYTGIGQYTRGLLREFGDADHFRSLEVFVPTLPDAQDLDFGPQVHVAHAVSRRLDHRALGAVSGAFSPRLKRHFFEQHAAMNFFRKQKVDLVHFPYPAHPFRPLEIPSIVTVHDVIPWIFPDYASGVLSSLAHRFARHNIHLATHLVTVSQFSKREIMRVCGISEKKISVIHNGCSPVYGEVAQQRGDLSHQLPENLRGKPYILYVGGYDRRKNVELLLQSFERFLKVEPEATLVLVGKPAHASSLYDVPSLGRVRNVFRTDFLDEESLAVLYRFCRFFIHLSSYEGFNIPLLEAMTSGAPVVLSDTDIHREIASSAGFFVDALSEFEIAAAMEKIWHDRLLREKLSKHGLEQAKKYSWKVSSKRHFELYQKLS